MNLAQQLLQASKEGNLEKFREETEAAALAFQKPPIIYMNVLCFGPGLGKSTFVKRWLSLENSKNMHKGWSHKHSLGFTGIDFSSSQVFCEEHHLSVENFRFRMLDVPGQLYPENVDALCKFLEDRFIEYLTAGLDFRYHMALFFINPASELTTYDFLNYERVQKYVNIVPVIAQADVLTPAELPELRKKINLEFEQRSLNTYQRLFPALKPTVPPPPTDNNNKDKESKPDADSSVQLRSSSASPTSENTPKPNNGVPAFLVPRSSGSTVTHRTRIAKLEPQLAKTTTNQQQAVPPPSCPYHAIAAANPGAPVPQLPHGHAPAAPPQQPQPASAKSRKERKSEPLKKGKKQAASRKRNEKGSGSERESSDYEDSSSEDDDDIAAGVNLLDVKNNPALSFLERMRQEREAAKNAAPPPLDDLPEEIYQHPLQFPCAISNFPVAVLGHLDTSWDSESLRLIALVREHHRLIVRKTNSLYNTFWKDAEEKVEKEKQEDKRFCIKLLTIVILVILFIVGFVWYNVRAHAPLRPTIPIPTPNVLSGLGRQRGGGRMPNNDIF